MDSLTINGIDVGVYFANTYVKVAFTLLAALIAQMILRTTINHIVKRVVRGHKYKSKVDEQKREKTLSSIFQKSAGLVIWIIAVIVILGFFNVNLAALVTGAGVVSLVIGFGAQNAIKDYLAGIYIIAENQYRVGDIVTLTVAGKEVGGVVEDLTIRITQLRDLDGNLHTVPNGSSSFVTNRSFKFANVNIDVFVSYSTDFEKAREVINMVGKAQAGDELWKDKVLEPIQFLRVDSFNPSSVTLKSVGKVQPAAQWDLAGDFRLRIKKAFDKSGIEIPLPQIVMHQAEVKHERAHHG